MPAKPVYVYRNLRVKTRVEWVIAERPQSASAWPRATSVTLRNVTFKESAAAWARCLRNVNDKTCKHGWDVHAYAVGELLSLASEDPKINPGQGRAIPVTYDKYGCGRFIRKDTRQPISFCKYLSFNPDGSTVAFGEVK